MNSDQIVRELEAACKLPTIPHVVPYHTMECAIVAIKAMQSENTKLREQVEESLPHLGNALDETVTTRRGEWPRHLFCVVCGCNVSKQEPHKGRCIIGEANAFWDKAVEQSK